MASHDIDNDQPLKSMNSDIPTYVTFYNNTNRTIHLFWVGFDGKLVNYGKLIPKKGTLMDTFVTHPWVAKDSVTAFTLLMNGKTTFFPREHADGIPFENHSRDLVNIHIPVFSLLQRCVEVVHSYFGKEKLKTIELPKELKETVSNLAGPCYERQYKYLEENGYSLVLDPEISDDDDDDDDD